MPNLHVYYGCDHRYNQASLAQIQQMLGMECDYFDGLEAIFDYSSKDAALSALLLVRGLGVRAEVDGLGEGPTKDAHDKARYLMRESYDREIFNKRGRRRDGTE